MTLTNTLFFENLTTIRNAAFTVDTGFEGLTANWEGNRFYDKSTFLGRVWTFIHWVFDDADESVAKVVAETVKFLGTVSEERKLFCDSVNADGVMGNFWKTRSITVMRTEAENHLQFNAQFHPDSLEVKKLRKIVEWAIPKLKITADEQVVQKTSLAKNFNIFATNDSLVAISNVGVKLERADKLERTWKRLNGDAIAPFATLYDQLTRYYPRTDSELIAQRNQLQEAFGKDKIGGNDCPPELLFGPLIHIAYEIGRQLDKHSIKVYSSFFDKLVSSLENNRIVAETTKQVLIAMTEFLSKANEGNDERQQIPNLPELIQEKLKDRPFVNRCRLVQTTAVIESDSKRITEAQKNEYAQKPHQNITVKHSDKITDYDHRRFYCYITNIDGSKKLDVDHTIFPAT